MGRRLVDRRTCEACGLVVDVRDDGQEDGHAQGCGPAAPEAPAVAEVPKDDPAAAAAAEGEPGPPPGV